MQLKLKRQDQLECCVLSVGLLGFSRIRCRIFIFLFLESCISVKGPLLEASWTSISSFTEVLELFKEVLTSVKGIVFLEELEKELRGGTGFFIIIRHNDHQSLMLKLSGRKNTFQSNFSGTHNEKKITFRVTICNVGICF